MRGRWKDTGKWEKYNEKKTILNSIFRQPVESSASVSTVVAVALRRGTRI